MSEPFIGEIKMLGFPFSPRGYSFCNGATLAIAQNSTLYALLGTMYGGDGRTAFMLPNLVSRSPVGCTGMGGSSGDLERIPQGHAVGVQYQNLTIANMPAHSHAATFEPEGSSGGEAMLLASTENADSDAPSQGAYLANVVRGGGGQDKDEKIYKSSPSQSSLVELGGLHVPSTSGGQVTVGDTGKSQQFPVQSPALAINFSIAMLGLFPSRN